MLLILGLLGSSPSRADGLEGGPRAEVLNVGSTRDAFLNVNRNDLEAAYQVLATTIGRRYGYLVTSKMQVFDAPEDLDAALREGTIRLAIVDSVRYLKMDRGLVEPVFVSSERGQIGRTYMVLTRRDSGLTTLADLRGKEIIEYEVSNTNLGHPWLEHLLAAGQLGTHDTFFSRVESTGRPAAAVLPVFFGKRPACVVDSGSFEVMNELNPQVGKALRAIAVSEPLTAALICFRAGEWSSETFRRDLRQALGTFHRETAGRQLLTLFKTDQLVPFEDRYLDAVKRLRAGPGARMDPIDSPATPPPPDVKGQR